MNKIIHFFYKIIHGPYPCGRTKETSYLCCTRPINKYTTYITRDRKEAYCRFCNTCRISANQSIKSLKHSWD